LSSFVKEGWYEVPEDLKFILKDMINKEDIKKELDFCIKLREEQGGCSFGKSTKCEQCAAISVLRKLYS
jgi:hypothetical protein